MHFLVAMAWSHVSTTGLLHIGFLHNSNLIVIKYRFQHIPSYGNGVIRKFANNTSEMKNSQHGTLRTFYKSVMLLKLPTCMVNVLSQCAMPIFEGLFPEDHNKIVQSLLYRFAQWHALAKIRIHSETTLSVLDLMFTRLSHQLRHF
jgi:hypothetical protein